MKKWLGFVLLAVGSTASAETQGFANVGYSITAYDVDFSDGVDIELDTGQGFRFDGGVRFDSGLQVSVSYMNATHDGGEIVFNDRVVGSFDEDLTLTDLRLGVFYAPAHTKTLGYRVGGGYMKLGFDLDAPGADEDKSQGIFAEGALLINAGKVVTFDLSGAAIVLEADGDGTSYGAELRALALFHVGAVDLGLGYRAMALTTEYDDDDQVDDLIGEFRFSIGGSWDFPGSNR